MDSPLAKQKLWMTPALVHLMVTTYLFMGKFGFGMDPGFMPTFNYYPDQFLVSYN